VSIDSNESDAAMALKKPSGEPASVDCSAPGLTGRFDESVRPAIHAMPPAMTMDLVPSLPAPPSSR